MLTEWLISAFMNRCFSLWGQYLKEIIMKFNWEILEGALNVAIAALAPLAMVAWIIGRI